MRAVYFATKNRRDKEAPMLACRVVTRFVPFPIAALALALSAAAHADVPGPDGRIHGCYNKTNGQVRVIDPTIASCLTSELLVSWNAQGVEGPKGDKGDKGDKGEPGANGTNGVSCTAVGLSTGDANCPAGGARFTCGDGAVTYACNGQNGNLPQPETIGWEAWRCGVAWDPATRCEVTTATPHAWCALTHMGGYLDADWSGNFDCGLEQEPDGRWTLFGGAPREDAFANSDQGIISCAAICF